MDDFDIDMNALMPEDQMVSWAERIDLQLRMARHHSPATDRADDEFAELVTRYRSLSEDTARDENSHVRLRPSGFPGTMVFGCTPSQTRPQSIRSHRKVYPDRPGAAGTIDVEEVQAAHGSLEFSAEITNSANPAPGDYSVWMRQWMYLYRFPSPTSPATVHYEFSLWPNVWWFTETSGRRVQIYLHLGIKHIADLRAPTEDIAKELWPVIIDTHADGRYGFPSGSRTTISGKFGARRGGIPALVLIPGVFVLAPNGLVRLPHGFFWVSQEFPSQTTDESRWGWLKYCVRKEPIIAHS